MDKRELIPRVPASLSFEMPPEEYRNIEEVNLYFIHSCGLQYLKSSNDPIFPANLEGSDLHWMDPSPHPHIIGYRHTYEICDSDTRCFDQGNYDLWDRFSHDSNRSASEAAVMNLLTIAMRRAHSVMQLPLVPELLAERLHTTNLSIGLRNGHWQQEMRRRFDMQMSTVQNLIIDMIQERHDDSMGEYRIWPGPDTVREACSGVKFQTVGWRNINLVEMVLFSTLLLVLWISTIKYDGRILLTWLFVSLIGPRASRAYKSTMKRIDVPITAIAKMTEQCFSRRLSILPYQPNDQELSQVRENSQDLAGA